MNTRTPRLIHCQEKAQLTFRWLTRHNKPFIPIYLCWWAGFFSQKHHWKICKTLLSQWHWMNARVCRFIPVSLSECPWIWHELVEARFILNVSGELKKSPVHQTKVVPRGGVSVQILLIHKKTMKFQRNVATMTNNSRSETGKKLTHSSTSSIIVEKICELPGMKQPCALQ